MIVRWRYVALLVLATSLAVGSASAAPKPPLKKLPRAPKARVTPRSLACPTRPGQCLTYNAFLTWVGKDVERFWATEFAKAGAPWQAAHQIDIPEGSTTQTKCSGSKLVAANTGPFYCSIDGAGTVFLPLLGIKSVIFPGSPNYVAHA